MQIAAITGQGLRWIAALVLVLWGCIVLEHSTVKHARRNAAKVFSELNQMREGQRPLPASRPSTRPNLEVKPVVG